MSHTSHGSGASVRSVTGAQARVTLALIGIITCVSFVDRVMLGILAPQIKADLAITDTQLGLLAGLAFTLLYSICGFPLALYADRASRRWLIAASVAVWSLATAACGLAASFWQLMVARVVVGVGEAGAGPASYSIICDAFPERDRPPAMAVYVFGAMAGTTIGLSLTGWLSARYGWHAAFVIVGLPGLLLAVLAAVFVTEPLRGAHDQQAPAQGGFLTARQTARALYWNRPFLLLAVGNGLAAFCVHGMSLWLPSFFAREHGLTVGQISAWFGMPFGIALMGGAAAGGALGGWCARKRIHLLYVSALSMFAICGLYIVALCVTQTAVAICMVTICAFLTGLSGPAYTAVTLNIVGPRVRATAQAVVTFLNTVLAYGLGASGVGVLSDLLKPTLGLHSLRWSLVAGQSFCLAAAIIYASLIRRLPLDEQVFVRSRDKGQIE